MSIELQQRTEQQEQIEPIDGTEKFLRKLNATQAEDARARLCGRRIGEIFDAVQEEPRHISREEFTRLFAEHRVYALEHGCITAAQTLLQQKQVLVPKPNGCVDPETRCLIIDPECLQIPWGHQVNTNGAYRWLFAPADVKTVESQVTLYKDRNPKDRRKNAHYMYLGQKQSIHEEHPLMGDREEFGQIAELFQVNRDALDLLMKKTKRGKDHARTERAQWPHFQAKEEMGVLNSTFTNSMCYVPIYPPSRQRRSK